jgi:hypothetical protein
MPERRWILIQRQLTDSVLISDLTGGLHLPGLKRKPLPLGCAYLGRPFGNFGSAAQFRLNLIHLVLIIPDRFRIQFSTVLQIQIPGGFEIRF